MKKSILLQKSPIQKSNKKNIKNSQQKPHIMPIGTSNNNEILQGMCKIMQFLIIRQQKVQMLKEMLTSKVDFNPETLFKYIARHEPEIDKKNIVFLFEENSLSISEEQIKLLLHSYGYKDKLDYSAFINLIFPVNVDLLKYISVTGIKKYSNQTKVTEQVLFIYLLLIQEQINLLQELDSLKNELIPKITRKQIKQLMRTIKKNGECNSQMDIQSQHFLSYQQLKTLFKKLAVKNNIKNPPSSARTITKKPALNKSEPQQYSIYSNIQKNLPCAFRKLSMSKNSFINLEDLQFWLRPWPRSKCTTNFYGEDSTPRTSNIFEISGITEVDNWSKISLKENCSLEFPLTLVHNQ